MLAADNGIFSKLTKLAILVKSNRESRMKAQSAKDGRYNFGCMIDMARAEPVVIEKHGRPILLVVAVEEYGRLTGAKIPAQTSRNLNRAEGS